MSQEIYINNISVISYNNITYSMSQKPQNYSVNDPLLVSADNSVDYLSPPWQNNSWSYIQIGDWKYNGKNILKYSINLENSQLSCGFLSGTSGYSQYGTNGYVWNQDSTTINNNDLLKGFIYINIFTQKNSNQKNENMLKGQFYTIPNSNGKITGFVNGQVTFGSGFIIPVRGLLYGELQQTRIETLDKIYDVSGNILSGSIYQIKNLSGTVQNTQAIPSEFQSKLKNYEAYGWLNGYENLIYTNKFLRNQISGYVYSQGRNNPINIEYSGTISLPINNNYIIGTVTKPKNSPFVNGYLQGTISVQNKPILMGGIFNGKVDFSSKRNKTFNNTNNTILELEWISGSIHNLEPINDDTRYIIDIKKNNSLGRKNLYHYFALKGKNLDRTSKNYDINNKPFVVQTWKIIKYQLDNNLKNKYLQEYGQNQIDIKTYLASNDYVRNKQIFNQQYDNYQYKQIITPSAEYYYCKWNLNQDNIIMIIEKGQVEQTSYFAGPYNSIEQGQLFIKQFMKAKNMKLVNKKDNNYYLESINIQI